MNQVNSLLHITMESIKDPISNKVNIQLMVYLNDEFTGGNTNFLDNRSKPHGITYALKPETGIYNQRTFDLSINDLFSGMVLIFEHDMFHEGEAITTGKKYIMRR